MNQSDLSSWMLAGSYVVKAQVPHRYQFGMSYSLQRYEGGNTAALMAVADTARNVGSVFAYDEWQISRYISVGYGANYAHYDYLRGPSLFSPRVSATFSPSKAWRVRAAASREVSAPGAEEFIPPTSAEYLPPQRTFSPISNAGIRTQALQNYEVGVERVLNGAALARARVRSAHRRSDRDGVRLAPRRRRRRSVTTTSAPPATPTVRGVGVTFTHALADEHSRLGGLFVCRPRIGPAVSAPVEYAVLSRWVPSAVRSNERIHDVTTSLETEIPYSATRVVVLYKLNNAFAGGRQRRRAGVRRAVRYAR